MAFQPNHLFKHFTIMNKEPLLPERIHLRQALSFFPKGKNQHGL